MGAFGGSQHDNLIARMWHQLKPSRIDARIEIELKNESADDFISHLDSRGQKLMVREMFGRTSYPGNVTAEG